MANIVMFGRCTDLAGTIAMPANRGPFTLGGLVAFSRQSLPDDPIGTTTVTFDGVPANSEIRVSLSDQTELAGIESCAENQVLSWPVYAPGPNSTVRIVIVNLAYKIQDFTYTPKVGNVSIPVQMDRDTWFSNP